MTAQLSATCLLSFHNPHPVCQQILSALPSQLPRTQLLLTPACAALTQVQAIIIPHYNIVTPATWSPSSYPLAPNIYSQHSH